MVNVGLMLELNELEETNIKFMHLLMLKIVKSAFIFIKDYFGVMTSKTLGPLLYHIFYLISEIKSQLKPPEHGLGH